MTTSSSTARTDQEPSVSTASGAQTGTGRRAPAERSPVRRDIQGLRAIAVLLVLVYHLEPGLLPGGFIGVDIFFVLSGFLITGQLLRELEQHGRVRLARFWARRARRLLPAALTVLAATLVAVWLLVPAGLAPSFFTHIAAAAGYAENWLLAGQAVDYLAAAADATPVQHYWSLSVEEQFYVIWPLLALGAAWAVTRLGAAARTNGRSTAQAGGGRRRVRAFGAVVLLIAAASLTFSVVQTANDPAPAYFATTVRAWEFAFGGVLAWAVADRRRLLGRLAPGARTALLWAGLAGLAIAAATFSDATPFPGGAALLPVLATVLVIAAAEPRSRCSPAGLLAARPVQWLGDVSYAVYLWHFPLIVLLPFALGGPLGPAGKLAVLVAVLVLAGLSKRFVEDPFRSGFARAWSTRRVPLAAAAGMAVVVAAALVGAAATGSRGDTERERIASALEHPAPCTGPGALSPESGCDPLPERPPVPDTKLADRPDVHCLGDIEGDALKVCEYGVDAAAAERTIALVGDSHAEQWLPSLKWVAEREHWRLIVMAKGSCPFTAGERDYASLSDTKNLELRNGCSSWNAQVLTELAAEPRIDALITSAKSSNRIVSGDQDDWKAAAARGYEERWSELPASVDRVIAIRDTPAMSKDVIDCIDEHGATAARACAAPEQQALDPDPLVTAAAAPAETSVELVDMTDYFVVDGTCPPVIGGVLVFRDAHHLSWAYAEMLAEPLGERVDAALSA